MESRAPRKVLMLCYHFPPGRNGGVEPNARMARGLPAFGWEPIVVTTNRWGSAGADELPRVVRVGELLRFGTGRRGNLGRREDAPSGGAPSRGGRPRSGLPRPLLRFAEKWLLLPDKHVRWTARALPAALGILRRKEADAIYTTSPPASAHMLGLLLKRLTGTPWVMDLRDTWALEPLSRYLRQGGVRLSLERAFERACVRAADRIVAATEEAAEAYRARYPGAASRIEWIPNGYDGPELERARATVRECPYLDGIAGGTFVIGHLGTFSRHTDEPSYPKGLLDALAALARRGAISPGTARAIFAGPMNPETARLIGAYDLGAIVSTPGPVPHIDALRIMLRSDLLLLYDPNPIGEHYIHGKLFEYLAADRWVLGVVPPGASRRLLERSGRALAIVPDRGEEIERALAEAMRRRGSPRAGAFDVSRYEAGRLASRLADVLGKASHG